MNIFGKITRKMLLRNRTRTLVTIVGIILSTAMFTAVTTFVVSLQTFAVNTITNTEGCWEGVMFGAQKSTAEQITSNEKVKDSGMLQRVGEAEMDENKGVVEYNYIIGADEDAYSVVNFGIYEGEKPKNTNEIVLSARYSKVLGYKTGDTITLTVGKRNADGKKLNMFSPYTEGEQLDSAVSKTYTITGFHDSLIFNTAGGSISITGYDDSLDTEYGSYFTLTDRSGIFDFMDEISLTENSGIYFTSTHGDLLRMYGISQNDTFLAVLYSLAAVLVGLIMLGSVSLINNAFSISVTERTKQFGLLSSVGATRKQICYSVVNEAMTLSVIAIPLGVLSGIAGIGVTLFCLSDAFGSLSPYAAEQRFDLTVNIPSVLIAAGISLVTVFISALIPAFKAMRITAIDAIRQSKDIKINKRCRKVSKLTKKLFGLEGTIASKHYKRNRKNYRATIISLTISIVLFVTASAFCDALSMGTADVYDYSGDIAVLVEDEDPLTAFETAQSALNVNGITSSAAMTMIYFNYEINDEYKTNEYSERFLTSKYTSAGKTLMFAILDDKSFAAYAQKCGLKDTDYSAADGSLPCIARKNVMYRDYAMNKYCDYPIVRDNIKELTMFNDEKSASMKLSVLSAVDFAPEITPQQTNTFVVYVPYSAFIANADNAVFDNTTFGVALFAMAGADSPEVTENIEKYFNGKTPDVMTVSIIDLYTAQMTVRNIILIINVFTYGFIILISLISAANVFNTISTNLMLRRREFAMLRTVGMTKGGLNKMMNYECILYGIKSSVYGIILSMIFVQMITMSVNNGVETALVIPWASLGIALVSVFLVVFSTMLYSMHRIKKDNPIEALRNENI